MDARTDIPRRSLSARRAIALFIGKGPRRKRLGVTIAVLGGTLLAQHVTSLSVRASDGDQATFAQVQASPTGEQLIHRMAHAMANGGTFHERLRSTTMTSAARETVTENLEVDLRHHLLHQSGVDRNVRLPHMLLHLDRFERISVGHRSATKENGGAWSCQRFTSSQTRLIGQGTFLAGLGRPNHAVNLGLTLWHSLPAWHMTAMVSGGDLSHGSLQQGQVDLFIRHSDNALFTEIQRPRKGALGSAAFTRYGAPVHIALPAACRSAH
jgi:hypothetical protein